MPPDTLLLRIMEIEHNRSAPHLPGGAGLPPGRKLCPWEPNDSWLPTLFIALMGASTRLSNGGRFLRQQEKYRC